MSNQSLTWLRTKMLEGPSAPYPDLWYRLIRDNGAKTIERVRILTSCTEQEAKDFVDLLHSELRESEKGQKLAWEEVDYYRDINKELGKRVDALEKKVKDLQDEIRTSEAEKDAYKKVLKSVMSELEEATEKENYKNTSSD